MSRETRVIRGLAWSIAGAAVALMSLPFWTPLTYNALIVLPVLGCVLLLTVASWMATKR